MEDSRHSWWRLTRGILAFVLLLNVGCQYRQSETIRASSFHEHIGRRIGQVDIEIFLRSRVAYLISSDQNLTNKSGAGGMQIMDDSNYGCAAMIDRRGYFLTAAHCLRHRYVYLVFHESQTTRTFLARVVWQGDSKKGQPDLAILHVKRMLDHTFDWAAGVHQADPVIAVGLSWTNKPSLNLLVLKLDLMGGRILDFNKLKDEAGDFNVATNVPLQSGDSGGPLVDAEGRLIGINVQGTPPLVHRLLPKRMFPMLAERPNQKWLMETIEEDAARQPHEATKEFSP
jgi:S1-C subfamily serine protease